MFNFRSKSYVFSKFLTGGVINTAVGFAVILLLMNSGVDAIVANTVGYAVGLVLSFTLNRRYVFMTQGLISGELWRFLAAFGASFLANVAVLHALITALMLDKYVSQLVAATVYTALMFVLCNTFVFKDRQEDSR